MYKVLQRIKRIFIIILYNLFCLFKINSKKVLIYSPSNDYLSLNLSIIKNNIKNRKVKVFYQNKKILLLLYNIATSKLIITDDYSPILYPLKIRKKAKFIQVWHASGVFKKVGFIRPTANKNSITHKNYTDVIVSSTNIVNDYSEAFGIDKSKIKPLGTIKTDLFFDKEKVNKMSSAFKEKYNLGNKIIILYAPTFRGNIYQGFSMLPFDGEKLINSFDENTYLIYKLHPLLKNVCLPQHPRIIDMFNEDTHELFALSDLLISDFSSIVFDYSILNKTMYFYVPDLNDYLKDVGCYVNIDLFPGKICKNIDELIQGIQKNEVGNLEAFKNIFFEYQDGKNTKRVVELIYDILKKSL